MCDQMYNIMMWAFIRNGRSILADWLEQQCQIERESMLNTPQMLIMKFAQFLNWIWRKTTRHTKEHAKKKMKKHLDRTMRQKLKKASATRHFIHHRAYVLLFFFFFASSFFFLLLHFLSLYLLFSFLFNFWLMLLLIFCHLPGKKWHCSLNTCTQTANLLSAVRLAWVFSF